MANFLDKTGLQEYDRLVKEHIANKFSQYVDLSSAQTITGNKITTGTFKVQNGDAKGSFVVGADVNAKTLTANTRKLGRMGVPAYTSNGSTVTSTVAGISFDAQANANYADFGGHPNNTSSIAPDVIRFVVANQHNNTINGARTLALQISKQDGLVDTSGGGTSVASAKFFVPVQATSTVTSSGGFVGDLTGKASDSDKLDGNDSAYFLNYDNFTNTPTIPSTASEVGADPSGSANTALTNAKSYTDTQIANLINGAPDTLNTLGEIATAMSENASVVTALQSAIGDKANKTDIPTDYISTGSTTQCRVGGLVLGQSSVPSGVNPSAGRVYVIGSNPLFGLKSTSGSTQFFLQVNGDNLYLGPTSANALQFTSTGATSVPKTFEAKGLLTATGGLKTNKIQVPTTSGGATYGVGSNGQVLTSNGSTTYWGSLSASSVGLGNVENKSSETIRSELTKSNITTALGYTPPMQDTTYSEATTTTSGLMSATDKTKMGVTNVAYGTCTTPAETAAKVVTISGNDNWELTTGSIIVVKFSATNTASNPTLNVNGTGAKPVTYGTINITTATSNLFYAGYKNRHIEYMYNGESYVFIGWSYDANNTYTNASLGQGYGICYTAETTLAKTVVMTGYSLNIDGITVIKFTNAVPANSTLNINSMGAKSIYWKGSAITDGVIKAGDTASFIFDGRYYQCFSVDKNVVTLDTNQTITGIKEFKDKIVIRRYSESANGTVELGTIDGTVEPNGRPHLLIDSYYGTEFNNFVYFNNHARFRNHLTCEKGITTDNISTISEASFNGETFFYGIADFSDAVVKGLSFAQKVTYNELVELRDTAQLEVGKWYRIIDYTCTTTQPNTRSAGHQFDIIMLALSANRLSENAYADFNNEDRYFSGGAVVSDQWYQEEDALVLGAVVPIYYLFEDWENGENDTLTEGYKDGDNFIAYGYLENPDGDIVPVLYKTDTNNVEDNPEEFGFPDYDDPFYYIGTEEIDGTLYDKWRKINLPEEEFAFESDAKCYVYTNIVVKNNRFIDSVILATAGSSEGGGGKPRANIPAWQIKYCLDNDKTRFAWADEENGKGVIYYMKDEWGNECPYDFKNIQFERPIDWQEGHSDFIEGLGLAIGDVTWFYTFSWITENFEVEDLTLRQDLISDEGTPSGIYGNVINSLYTNSGVDTVAIQLNDIIFISSWQYDSGFFYGCFNNVFKQNCSNNTLGNSCRDNSFGVNCTSNVCGNSFEYNILNDNCGANYFVSTSQYNSLGPNCKSIYFGEGCLYNTLGSCCDDIKLKGACSYNKIGNSCHTITMGEGSSHNTFGTYCHNIKFGESDDNTINNVENVNFAPNVFGIRLRCAENSISRIKNITILSGVGGPPGNGYLDLEVERNAAPVVYEANNTKHIILD